MHQLRTTSSYLFNAARMLTPPPLVATNVLPEEAEYFMQLTGSDFLLVGSDRMIQATAVQNHILERVGKEIVLVPTPSNEGRAPDVNVELDDQIKPSPTRPAVAMLTSGTTSRPKAVVLPRGRLYSGLTFEPDTVILACRPHHWIGGMRTLVQPLLHGHTVHILPRGAGSEVIWRCLRDNPVTNFSINPYKLRQLKEYFQQHLSSLSEKEVDEYIRGFRRLKMITCSGAMIDEGAMQFWHGLVGDIPIINIYALTETGPVTRSRPHSKPKVRFCTLSPYLLSGMCLRYYFCRGFRADNGSSILLVYRSQESQSNYLKVIMVKHS